MIGVCCKSLRRKAGESNNNSINSQVRVFNVHIQSKLVVAHACHGHRYRPSSVPLSGTGKKWGRE